MIITIGTVAPETIAQFTNEEYNKALWMTTRMYGGQRSGAGPNWLIMDHTAVNDENGNSREGQDFINDATDDGYDLSGGWHDCGDHVKFGQTQYYSAYVLLLGYAVFPQGYDDYYAYDYNGYQSAGDFTWESAQGAPNGIPDILDEVKYATDYFIKCARNDNTFYSQVGNGDYDHKQWVTSAYMATLSTEDGGEPRPVMENPNDGAMASFCGATLALMSRMYRPFDEAYADLCLEHALHAYAYASSNKSANGGTISGSYYSADKDWRDNYVCLTAELYHATGDESYKDEALSYAGDINNHGWVLGYRDSEDLALYNLMKLGDSNAGNTYGDIIQNYKNNVNNEGVIAVGDQWGALRYSASAAFSIALYNAANNDTSNIDSDLKGTVDYILGNNSANQSFVVGFGNNSPEYPHHRNVFLDDRNIGDGEKEAMLSIPQRNQQHGFMVGGVQDNPGNFADDINDWQTSEGCIDYQSGLVGALAYMRSINDPVDTTRFVTGTKDFDKTLAAGDDFSVYPNPAKDKTVMEFEQLQDINTSDHVSAYDMKGKAHRLRISGNGNVYRIDLSKLNSGIYMIQLSNNKGQLIHFKVNKQ